MHVLTSRPRFRTTRRFRRAVTSASCILVAAGCSTSTGDDPLSTPQSGSGGASTSGRSSGASSNGGEAPMGAAGGFAGYDDVEWHEMEIYVRPRRGPDGQTRVWMDAALVVDHDRANISERGNVFDTFFMLSNWSGGGLLRSRHRKPRRLDDIEVFSDHPSGDPATGALADGSASAL